MKYIIIGVIIYALIGIIRVGADYVQPITNQPHYVREGKLLISLLLILFWPILVLGDIFFGMKE